MNGSSSYNIAEVIEQRIKEVESAGTPSRSEAVMIGSEQQILTVISLPTSQVKLNHNNHRLTAQLQEHFSGDFLEDPFSRKSQQIIEEKLAETEKFQQLKSELKDLQQREPGIITRDGLLINGNTRCAALRQLEAEGVAHARNINVAVLKKGVLQTDIINIEMNLQMQKLTHQEYTFTNELLFMKQYRDNNQSDKALANAMNWRRRGEAKVQQHMRVLDIIEEARRRRSPPLPYKLFDTKKTHLLDLDKEMLSLQNEGDSIGAENVKNQRLLALFMGLNKDQVREIDQDLFDTITKDIPSENEALSSLLNKHFDTLGLDDEDFTDEPSTNEKSLDMDSLLSTFLNQPNLIDEGSENLNPEFEEGFKALAETLSSETDRSIIRGREATRDQELSTTMRSIREDISNILAKLPERVGSRGFNTGVFQYELKKAREELDRIKSEFERLS